MALQIHTPSTFTNGLYHRHVIFPKPKFSIRSQKPTVDTEPTPEPTSSTKKPAAPGQGFGSPSSSSSPPGKSGVSSSSKKKQKGRRERASIIRRSPVEKPAFAVSKEEEAKAEEQRKNESAFLLAWLGLGGIILVQGIVLAASGFLPEEWDKFFVKYLYPVFTPTVLLFLAGTVAYGVLKYLQNESLKDQNAFLVKSIFICERNEGIFLQGMLTILISDLLTQLLVSWALKQLHNIVQYNICN
ncbi:hypothetical protein COLO4_14153 [Corchorus olitorius]|uniref:Protein LOW PSII ACCUMULATION 2, chloroplastic n=1 Tax=Corchorus olitorius TaxID=93759 RepID=A0A1R3JT53_9ROSI|nr:hypothetical protein COLO4_14153 [Corchorus olitorius]